MPFPSWLPWLLGFVTVIGPASIDMYLPAFTAIETSLGAAPGSAQITLAAYFAGLAIGQKTQGTLSDQLRAAKPHHRRDADLCAGVGLRGSFTEYWLAGGVSGLIRHWRSGGAVIPRAVVRDLATGQRAAVMMSQLMLVLGLAPILAPTLGGAALAFANWRWIFWILGGYAVVCCAVICVWLPETLPPERRIALHPGQQLARYGAILSDRVFLIHAAGCASFAFFSYLGGWSPVFIRGFQLSHSRTSWVPGFSSGRAILAAPLSLSCCAI
jgi:MFS transporter, DHA1 family, multidrug resistance protein